MYLEHLHLVNFRNYHKLDIQLPKGTIIFEGFNGEGKTNLLESIYFLLTMRSFRTLSNEALVCNIKELTHSDISATTLPSATLRAEIRIQQRELLLEAIIFQSGKSQFRLNKKIIKRRDILGLLPVSLFKPDDLTLVKGAPSIRRDFLDEILIQLYPRLDRILSNLDHILRQRNVLLRQVNGRLGSEEKITLDVWDQKLAEVGNIIGEERYKLVNHLNPVIAEVYNQIAMRDGQVDINYNSTWLDNKLEIALSQARKDDLRRGVTTIGPHRDDLDFLLEGNAAKTYASQGEQRSFALALRLAASQELSKVIGEVPLLMLDDVFSELDINRIRGVLLALGSEQTLLTTVGDLPVDLACNARYSVSGGQVIRRI